MKNHLPLIIIAALVINPLLGASKIAVATKVQGKVDFVKNGNVKRNSLKQGTILEDGDKIYTGASGFVAVVFIDDKSMIKIKEDTELEITGKRSNASISKKINMEMGTIRAMVSKQRKGEFVVETPTSVASVKGTDFWVISNPFTGDMLLGLDGLVNFTNLLTGQSIDIGAGFTGNSTPDGSLNSGETDPGTIPEDPDEAEGAGESTLRITLEGPDGTQKVLIIHYH
ncbi:MAG: FecR domain-containing protein [FCB group bacterium]|nr:FecR domain-containing protein [FCB group bacterium]